MSIDSLESHAPLKSLNNPSFSFKIVCDDVGIIPVQAYRFVGIAVKIAANILIIDYLYNLVTMKTYLSLLLIICSFNLSAQNNSETTNTDGDTKWIYVTTAKGGKCYLYNEPLKKSLDRGVKAWIKVEFTEFTVKGKIHKNVLVKQRINFFCDDNTYENYSTIIYDSKGEIITSSEREYTTQSIPPESTIETVGNKVCAMVKK